MVLQHFIVNSSDLHFSSFVFTLLPFSSNSLYSCDHQIPSGRSLFDFRTIISLYFGMFRVISTRCIRSIRIIICLVVLSNVHRISWVHNYIRTLSCTLYVCPGLDHTLLRSCSSLLCHLVSLSPQWAFVALLKYALCLLTSSFPPRHHSLLNLYFLCCHSTPLLFFL